MKAEVGLARAALLNQNCITNCITKNQIAKFK